MNIRNLIAYFNERFPLVNMMLFAILFLTVYSVAQFADATSHVDLSFIITGVVACISFFFRLRVFDEIKDYTTDGINHPQRVLQLGRVSITQLVLISATLTTFEIAWSLWSGTITFIFWLIAAGYSVLMRYEFFIGKYLRNRLVVYAFSHMLVMPLIIMWIWTAFDTTGIFHQALYLLALLSLCGGFSFEIARKIYAPAKETATIDSYSKSLGFKNAIVAVCVLLLTGIIVQFFLLNMIQARLWAYLLIGALFVSTAVVYVSASNRQSENMLRKAELFVSLFMLLSYISIIVETQF